MQRKFPVCSKIQQFYTRTFLLVSVFSIRSIYLMCILFILESRQDGASNSTKMQLHDIIAIHICDRIWEKKSVSEKINYHVCTEIVLLEHEDANGNKEKEAPSYSKAKHLDWLQNWMAPSSLDVKSDNNTVLFFSLTGQFSQITATYYKQLNNNLLAITLDWNENLPLLK